jgi:hypothetical protein
MKVAWGKLAWAVAAAGIAVVLMTGCSTASSGSEPAQTQASAGSSASATPATSGQPAVRRVWKPWYRRGMRTLGFQSPTSNIRCALQSDDRTQLLCKTLNNGNAVDLDSMIDVDRNITASIPVEPTLAYGRVWSSTNFFCWSRFTAVTCRSLHSRHGFAINRAGITVLIWDAPVLSGGGGATASGSSSVYGESSSSGSGNDSGGDFCSTHSCIDNFYNGSGYIVQCADGMWSHSGGESGACSWHGGEG